VMRFAAAHESGDGPTRTCGHVRSCAAAREKADIGGKLKTRAYWGLPLLTGSFHWQQKLNKPLFGEAFLHFRALEKCWTPSPHDFAVRKPHRNVERCFASIASRTQHS